MSAFIAFALIIIILRYDYLVGKYKRWRAEKDEIKKFHKQLLREDEKKLDESKKAFILEAVRRAQESNNN